MPESKDEINQPIEKEGGAISSSPGEIDLPGGYISYPERTPPDQFRIATIIVWAFVITLVACFLYPLALLWFIGNPSATSLPDNSFENTVKHTIELLKTTGTLFSPLLGFILAYYFTKK